MSSLLNLTSETFDNTILSSNKPVLVDFWAPWCGPCLKMGPAIDAFAEETNGILVTKVNVDECPDIAQKYNILSIPTLLVFKAGQVVDQLVGAKTKPELVQALSRLL